ncbi:MAG: hypothetical protein V7K54_02790 [Nostoc sp.]
MLSAKIERLAKEIKGVKNVVVKATVAQVDNNKTETLKLFSLQKIRRKLWKVN